MIGIINDEPIAGFCGRKSPDRLRPRLRSVEVVIRQKIWESEMLDLVVWVLLIIKYFIPRISSINTYHLT